MYSLGRAHRSTSLTLTTLISSQVDKTEYRLLYTLASLNLPLSGSALATSNFATATIGEGDLAPINDITLKNSQEESNMTNTFVLVLPHRRL